MLTLLGNCRRRAIMSASAAKESSKSIASNASLARIATPLNFEVSCPHYSNASWKQNIVRLFRAEIARERGKERASIMSSKGGGGASFSEGGSTEARMRALQSKNKNCFNCRGVVTYVVPKFGTFICTECSGKQ